MRLMMTNQLVENLPRSLNDASLLLSRLESIEICLLEQTSRGLFKYADQTNIESNWNIDR